MAVLVSIDWLKENLSNPELVILDSRPKTMYLYGHLPNSHSLTIEQVIQFDKFGSNLVPDVESVTSLFSSIGIDETKIVLVGGDSMDPSAARIAWTLLYFGHEKTFLLDANISDLTSQGFEFTRKQSLPKPSKFTPKINSRIRITSQALRENLENLTIIDARTPQEFMMGHLPGSKLIPFTDGIGFSGHLFQEKSALEKIFSDNNIPKDSEIICYCMHGHRAANLFFQLLIAGYGNIKLYDGSFVEWHGRGLPLD